MKGRASELVTGSGAEGSHARRLVVPGRSGPTARGREDAVGHGEVEDERERGHFRRSEVGRSARIALIQPCWSPRSRGKISALRLITASQSSNTAKQTAPTFSFSSRNRMDMVESDSLIGESVASSSRPSYSRHMARARSAMLLLMVALLLPVAAAAPGVAAPGTSTVVAKVKVGGQPCGVVGTPHGIWIADYAGNRLVRIDPATGAVGGEVVGVRQTCEITYTHGAVWAPSRTGALYRVDPVARKITARVQVGGDLDDVVATAGSVWVVSYGGRSVIRVNPRTNRVARRIALPGARGGASGITATGGAVWAWADPGDGGLPHRSPHQSGHRREDGQGRAGRGSRRPATRCGSRTSTTTASCASTPSPARSRRRSPSGPCP